MIVHCLFSLEVRKYLFIFILQEPTVERLNFKRDFRFKKRGFFFNRQFNVFEFIKAVGRF